MFFSREFKKEEISMRPLDRIDRMILDILQREGRIAISELASRVNLSTTPVRSV